MKRGKVTIKNGIPDRWIDYKPIGDRIPGTRFIAFKVPLREQVSRNVARRYQLDVNQLMEAIPNLGMIIDLTNSYRYYNPEVFTSAGIKHRKIMIPGHHTPADFLTEKFKSCVAEFLETNARSGKVIGVHCTHGVNRTGYMICNYMISELGMQPDDAMKRFKTARGHPVERKNYVEALHSLVVDNRRHTTSNQNHQSQRSEGREQDERSDGYSRSSRIRSGTHERNNNIRFTAFERNNRNQANSQQNLRNVERRNNFNRAPPGRYQNNSWRRNSRDNSANPNFKESFSHNNRNGNYGRANQQSPRRRRYESMDTPHNGNPFNKNPFSSRTDRERGDSNRNRSFQFKRQYQHV